MQGELGDNYVLYLLEDQEEKPVAVVLPKDAAEQPLPAAQEVGLPACPGCPPARAAHTTLARTPHTVPAHIAYAILGRYARH